MSAPEIDISFMDERITTNRCWLVCYPRSGSSWLRMILANLLHPEEPRGYRATDYMVPDFHAIHRWNWEKVRAYVSDPFIVKSHHPMAEAYAKEKVVYLVRDPRDVVISEYYFEQWEQSAERSFDDFFADFVKGKMKFQSWKFHVFCGLNATEWNDGAIKLIRYEDLYTNPVEEVGKVCEFVKYFVSESEIRLAVERCTFQNCIERSSLECVDARKRGLRGRPGGWREWLTYEQLEEMWKWAGTLMAQLGYKRNP